MNIRAPRTFCKYNRLHVPSPSHLQHYLSLFEVEEKAVEDWKELEQTYDLQDDYDAKEFASRESARLACYIVDHHPEVVSKLIELAALVRPEPKTGPFSPKTGIQYMRIDIISANWATFQRCGMPKEQFSVFAANKGVPHPLATSKTFRQQCLGLIRPSLQVVIQADDTGKLLNALGNPTPAYRSHDEVLIEVDQDASVPSSIPADLFPRRIELVSYRPFIFAGKQRGWIEKIVDGPSKPFAVPGRLWPAAWKRDIQRKMLTSQDLVFEDDGLISKIAIPTCYGCMIPKSDHTCF